MVYSTLVQANLSQGQVEGRYVGFEDEKFKNLSERIHVCEKIIQQQDGLQFLTELQQMREELQELRGNVDECKHQIKLLLEHTKIDIASRAVEIKSEQNNHQFEASEYQKATEAIEKKDYVVAIKKLDLFVKQFPKSQYLVNSYYWLGEIHTRLFHMNAEPEHLLVAKESFKNIIDHYPSHPKVCDALLKLGLLAMIEHNFSLAKSYFEQVIKEFKSSSAARIAEQKLRKLKNEKQY